MRAYFFWKSNAKTLAFGFAFRPSAAPKFFDARDRRFRTFVTVTLSLLLHLLVLWLLLHFVLLNQGGPAASSAQTLNVTLAGSPQRTAPQAAPPTPTPVEPTPTPTPTPPEPVEPVRPRRNIITTPGPSRTHVPEPSPLPPLPPLPQSSQPPQPSLSDMIAAKRDQRASDEAQERELEANGGSTESADQIARRHILSNLTAARGTEYQQGEGGMFEVKDKSFHTATLIFNGWNWKVGRKFPREFPIEQGSEPNIDMAIVDKVIEIIRETHPVEFEWDSRRMGKTVTRSARKEDTAELRAFLFAEFDYGDDVESNAARSPPPPRRQRGG